MGWRGEPGEPGEGAAQAQEEHADSTQTVSEEPGSRTHNLSAQRQCIVFCFCFVLFCVPCRMLASDWSPQEPPLFVEAFSHKDVFTCLELPVWCQSELHDWLDDETTLLI